MLIWRLSAASIFLTVACIEHQLDFARLLRKDFAVTLSGDSLPRACVPGDHGVKILGSKSARIEDADDDGS